MKIIFFLLFIVLFSITIKSQVLTVDSIEISRVITYIEEVSGEYEAEGPLVNFFKTSHQILESV